MIFFVLSLIVAFDHTTTKQIDFRPELIEFSRADEYTKVRIMGCEISQDVGAPEVPAKAFQIALPYGAEDISIEIIATESEMLDGEYLLSCAQPPQILSLAETRESVAPDRAIYGSDRLYPAEIITLQGTGEFDNHQVCELVAYPIQYKPGTRKLIFHKSIRFRIKYTAGTQRTAHSNTLSKMVLNPEDVMAI
ncbi:MAG: C25 family peptidase propeptide domain-containing protein, partial [candidate division WOR-3 bacterium]